MKPQNHDSISKRATRIRKLSQVSFPLLPHSTLVIRAGRTYLLDLTYEYENANRLVANSRHNTHVITRQFQYYSCLTSLLRLRTVKLCLHVITYRDIKVYCIINVEKCTNADFFAFFFSLFSFVVLIFLFNSNICKMLNIFLMHNIVLLY